MAEISIRRSGELVRKAFEILIDHPDGLPARDVLREIERRVTLSDFERSDYPNRPGDRRFERIVRFATIDEVKAGWIMKTKGHWILTELGRIAFSKFSDPEAFQREAIRLYRVWKKSQPSTSDEVVAPGDLEVPTAAATTLEEAEESSWSEVKRFLEGMTDYGFQDLVAALLRGMGYHVNWVAPPGPDGGMDIVAHLDPLGAQNPRIKVQVKHRADKAAADELRSFLSLLGEHDVGIFVASGGFTSNAAAEARAEKSRRLTLIDLEKLFDLWVEHFDRLSEEDKRLLPLKPVHFLAPIV
ncbi:MAG: Mrr restriction system protein [Candidatus Rokubacteria bacterium]|nr:Mrr restriction system protein [Candidatus Rokubacteria bacterium]